MQAVLQSMIKDFKATSAGKIGNNLFINLFIKSIYTFSKYDIWTYVSISENIVYGFPSLPQILQQHLQCKCVKYTDLHHVAGHIYD